MTTKREQKKVRNSRSLWAEREQAAQRSGREDAVLQYERARSEIAKIKDPKKAEAYYRVLAAVIADFNASVDGDNVLERYRSQAATVEARSGTTQAPGRPGWLNGLSGLSSLAGRRAGSQGGAS